MDGYEVARRIRANPAQSRHLADRADRLGPGRRSPALGGRRLQSPPRQARRHRAAPPVAHGRVSRFTLSAARRYIQPEHTAHLDRWHAFLMYRPVMKRRSTSTNKTRDMIRWQFRLRDRLLTCGVSQDRRRGLQRGDRSPSQRAQGHRGDLQGSVSALQRHAAIALQLRANGWSIASYTTT